MKPKVIVAMSGGVDSSVAAALLKKRGFDVTGIFMKCWSASLHEACTAQDDERMARLAARHLDIPFYVLNFIDEYQKRVVEYMLDGYEQGITPNPDVMCNKEIKFGLFFEKAMQLGADYVATGHYARVRPGGLQKTGHLDSHQLLKGKDRDKDQSYFLSFIRPKVLEHVLFPIGEYTKPEVRKMAKELGLPNAARKDSQGICFVGKVQVTDFLKQYIPVKPGAIQDMTGKLLGTHEGVQYYTIGQRRGIGLAGGPWYVVDKDREQNILTVSKNEDDIQKQELSLGKTNFFSSDVLGKVEVAIRYRQQPVLAHLENDNGKWRLLFEKSQRAVTPGQFAVLYRGEELLGGGVIA